MLDMKWIVLLLLSFCFAQETEQVRYLMGTYFSIKVPKETTNAIIQKAFSRAKWIEDIGSTYEPNSPITLLRSGSNKFF